AIRLVLRPACHSLTNSSTRVSSAQKDPGGELCRLYCVSVIVSPNIACTQCTCGKLRLADTQTSRSTQRRGAVVGVGGTVSVQIEGEGMLATPHPSLRGQSACPHFDVS